MEEKVKNIVNAFCTEGELVSCEPYGKGHINDTYCVETRDQNGASHRYIIQRVNHKVFPDIEGLMKNIAGVTGFIREKMRAEGADPERVLYVIPAQNGKLFHLDEKGNYYRCYNFIADGVSIETTPTARELYISGVGFGRFQRYLDGYPAEDLKESIPNFHNTEDRYEKLMLAVQADTAGRRALVEKEIAFFTARKDYASRVLNGLRTGEIPYRVTHNDTKLNNMLIDIEHGEAVAAVDLDTVMPGSVIYDFGDSIRSGANTAAEDETDLSLVTFSLELFEAFARGFMPAVQDVLTPAELETMAFGAILMTYECGMRFLTDYLNGDIYFKIHREHHNLDRAHTQMKLVEDMEKQLDKMNAIIKSMRTVSLCETPASFTLKDNLTGGEPAQKTTVHAACKQDGLAITFQMEENAFCVRGKRYNDALWEGDIAEIMITLGAENQYLEIEVNPDGVCYAVHILNRDMQGDIKITPLAAAPFTAQTTQDADGWTTDIQIPFAALKTLGWNPKSSKINFYRQDFAADGTLRLSALSPTRSGKFHVPSAFVSLTLPAWVK